jgi:hypothetical protein
LQVFEFGKSRTDLFNEEEEAFGQILEFRATGPGSSKDVTPPRKKKRKQQARLWALQRRRSQNTAGGGGAGGGGVSGSGSCVTGPTGGGNGGKTEAVGIGCGNNNYVPCRHPGKACDDEDANCICVQNRTFCEKFCVCPANCEWGSSLFEPSLSLFVQQTFLFLLYLFLKTFFRFSVL